MARMIVNGEAIEYRLDPGTPLLWALRDASNLTGTKYGCDSRDCGACTVIVDGRTARACLMLAVQVDGSTITTVEGLASGNVLNPLQEAFWNNHGLQCGFCTPGMLMTATELLTDNPEPDAGQVRECLSGNLCRCTGYDSIVSSVLDAAEKMRG